MRIPRRDRKRLKPTTVRLFKRHDHTVGQKQARRHLVEKYKVSRGEGRQVFRQEFCPANDLVDTRIILFFFPLLASV